VATAVPRFTAFHVSAEVPASMAKLKLTKLAEEIIAVLLADPYAEVSVTLEIGARFPNGITDNIRRAVAENASSLGLKNAEWE
jgi:hypothetical protein